VGALLPVLGHPSGAVARRARVMTADPDVAVARPLPMAGKPDHGAARPGRWRRNGLGRRRRRHRRIALRGGAEADGEERCKHECDADERSERRCQSSYSGSDYAAPNISIAASRRPRHASAEAWPIGRGARWIDRHAPDRAAPPSDSEIARQLVGPAKLQGASLWAEYREVAYNFNAKLRHLYIMETLPAIDAAATTPQTKALISRWGGLHAVRTALGCVATIAFLLGCILG
jgi:hypothetical protein